jgi:hypothetical protein
VRALAGAITAALALAHAGGAAASIALYPPTAFPSPPPPLGTQAQSAAGLTGGLVEFRLPGRISTSELVSVGIGADGAPVRVSVTQRLQIAGTGDYSLFIPAPAVSVVAGPGSQSLPGLRSGGILWQGFSDRHHVLSAAAVLRTQSALAGLPLRVMIARRDGGWLVRLENVTRHQIEVTTGPTTRAAVQAALAQLRAYFGAPGGAVARSAPPSSLDGQPLAETRLELSAPLHVTGTLAPGLAVDAVLGGSAVAQRSIVVPGPAPPRLELRVDLLPTPQILPRAAALGGAAHGLIALQAALAEVAISGAYRRYLASPDTLGPSQASYLYTSVRQSARIPGARRSRGGDVPAIVAVCLLGVGALAGLAVLWARS